MNVIRQQLVGFRTAAFLQTTNSFRTATKLLFLSVLANKYSSTSTSRLLASAFTPQQASPQTKQQHTSNSRLFSTSFVEGPPEEELSRWDQLYLEGEDRRNTLVNTEGMYATQNTRSAPVRVITFDLDNTLWNTGATISAANDALAEFLTTHKIQQSKRTEVIMGELFNGTSTKADYCPIDGKDGTSPVLLTKLRTDALTRILIDDNGYSQEDAEAFAKRGFDTWIEARYKAIPSHYSSNVLDVLETISNLHLNDDNSQAQQQPILIGAITDGNSDPRNVPELKPYFDFCINAEQVGVSKPDKRVYLQAALQHVFASGSLQDMGLPTLETEEQAENVIGPWWIHIGDDFTKDIVAAKNLNMRTVWVRELILDKIKKKQPNERLASQYNTDDDKGTDATEAEKLSPEQELVEFQKRINSKSVVTMAVGADDYLSTQLQQEFADATIDSFADLPRIIQDWQDRSSQQIRVAPTIDKTPTVAFNNGAPVPTVPDDATTASTNAQETKFCVFCGAKAPMAAKFCSECGKEQPKIQ